jgi:hypothetical protein
LVKFDKARLGSAQDKEGSRSAIVSGCGQLLFPALYGVVFPNEEAAAFSNYRLWESLGFVVAYIYGNRICVDAKLGSI